MTHPEREVVIVAHRGMAAGRPENTLPALRHSVAAGFPVIITNLPELLRDVLAAPVDIGGRFSCRG